MKVTKSPAHRRDRAQRTRVLCDPWLSEGIYYGSWFHYPPLDTDVEAFGDVDYVYVSHIHPDHMDVATLRQLPKALPLLIHDYEDKPLLRILSGLGFSDITEVAHAGDSRSRPLQRRDFGRGQLRSRRLRGCLRRAPTSPVRTDYAARFAGRVPCGARRSSTPTIAHTPWPDVCYHVSRLRMSTSCSRARGAALAAVLHNYDDTRLTRQPAGPVPPWPLSSSRTCSLLFHAFASVHA